MNKKMFLVISNYSNESSGSIDIENYKLFSNYESAKKYFEEIKQNIKSFELNYDYIEDTENLYYECVSGEYLYYHELVKIEELGVQE